MEQKRHTPYAYGSKQFSFQNLNATTPQEMLPKEGERERERETERGREEPLYAIKYFPHDVEYCMYNITCNIGVCLHAYPRRAHGARPEQLPLHTSITPLAVPIISRL